MSHFTGPPAVLSRQEATSSESNLRLVRLHPTRVFAIYSMFSCFRPSLHSRLGLLRGLCEKITCVRFCDAYSMPSGQSRVSRVTQLRTDPRVHRHRASKPHGSSERVLPWQVTMDQLICASLPHTHYRYEVGMLKVPADSYDVWLIWLGLVWFPLSCDHGWIHREDKHTHTHSRSSNCQLKYCRD